MINERFSKLIPKTSHFTHYYGYIRSVLSICDVVHTQDPEFDIHIMHDEHSIEFIDDKLDYILYVTSTENCW